MGLGETITFPPWMNASFILQNYYSTFAQFDLSKKIRKLETFNLKLYESILALWNRACNGTEVGWHSIKQVRDARKIAMVDEDHKDVSTSTISSLVLLVILLPRNGAAPSIASLTYVQVVLIEAVSWVESWDISDKILSLSRFWRNARNIPGLDSTVGLEDPVEDWFPDWLVSREFGNTTKGIVKADS